MRLVIPHRARADGRALYVGRAHHHFHVLGQPKFPRGLWRERAEDGIGRIEVGQFVAVDAAEPDQLVNVYDSVEVAVVGHPM